MQDNKFYQPDFIEAYLKNHVSEADKNTMEGLLQADESLKSEIDFQKDLIHAIGESRKKDLKQMLKDTPIPSYTGTGISNKWIVGGIAATLVTVVSIWFVQSNKQEKITDSTDKTVVKTPEEKTIVPEKETQTYIDTKKEESVIQKQNSKQETKKEEAISPFAKEIHYLYDGKGVVQLFGDFSYQILEKVDVGTGEKTYIYIQNKFYELVPTSEEPKILRETQVKDPEHIRLLTEKLQLK